MANAELKIVGDSDKAQSAITALEKKLDKLQNNLKQVSRKTRDGGREAQKAFGQDGVVAVTRYAAGFVSLTAGLSEATKAFIAFENTKKRFADQQRNSSAGLAELAQLAKNPQHHASLMKQADNAFASGVGKNKDEAGNLIFALESAGIAEDKRPLFVKLAAAGVVKDSSVFAKASDTLQASVGRAEAGSYNDIASKAFAASSFSPATAEALLESAAKGGGSISRLRMTDEELLAATAVAAKSSGSAEQGGTQINSLLASLEQAGGFEGKSLKSALESIQAMNMNGEELFKYFGRKESVAGFDTLLKNMDLFEDAISNINEAQRTNLAQRKIGLNSLIPEIAAPQALQESENTQALAFSQNATYANFAATIRNKRLTQAQESMGGAGYIGEYMWQTLEKMASYPIMGDEGFVRSQESRQFLEAVDPATLSRIQNANSYYDSQSNDRRQSQAGTIDALPATRQQIDESNRLLRELVGETKKKPLRTLKRNE